MILQIFLAQCRRLHRFNRRTVFERSDSINQRKSHLLSHHPLCRPLALSNCLWVGQTKRLSIAIAPFCLNRRFWERASEPWAETGNSGDDLPQRVESLAKRPENGRYGTVSTLLTRFSGIMARFLTKHPFVTSASRC